MDQQLINVNMETYELCNKLRMPLSYHSSVLLGFNNCEKQCTFN